MKFRRILAAVLSVLMLSSVMVFTANAAKEVSAVYAMKAYDGSGFSGEAVTGTKTYDAENDIIHYHFVPKDSADWMHFGWHGATNQFIWSSPMTVGMIMRTNKAGAVPAIRLCDRSDSNNKLTIEKEAAAIKGDGTWEVVWFPAVTQSDIDNVTKNGVTFDGLTHVQCFAMGKALIGNQNLESGLYFDIAGYAFFNDTPENLADIDLYEVIGVGAPEITISFDAQNGSEVTSYTATCGDYVSGKVVFPDSKTIEVPEGKIFGGWATDAAGENKVDVENTAVPAKDTTYYVIWAQDDSEPGDVTIKEIRLNGTLSSHFGLEDLSGETLTLKVPYNWNGDKVPELTVLTTDATAKVTVTAGTFATGSEIKVKNGSANVTYKVVYNNATASSKKYVPSGVVTSNPTGHKVPYNGTEYTVTGTTYISPARNYVDAEIAGDKGTKLTYNTKQEVYIPSNSTVNDDAKTISSASYYTIASDAAPGFEGGGAFGFITLSDYPWARVKYYIDAGEDGKTVARPFVIRSTSWNNKAKDKGYAESTKKNNAASSDGDMIAGRWAYAYVNLAEVFAEDYGYTYQFHFRPYNDSHKASNVMKASADDATVAVPVEAADGKFPELFDDVFYLGGIEIFNTFPGTEDGKYEQIAPFAGLFTVTDETEIDANDGTISGLAEDMEYRIKGDEEWTAYAEPALQGEVTLAPGTYEIRYAAYDNYAASPTVEVTIKSALAAKPEVEAVNATAVGKNNGKITGVDDTMSYRAKGAEEWTKVAEGATEITNLKPGTYEFIYLADGELRTENSEITEVLVLVDFDTDAVVYLTSNAANADAEKFDGSSYDKAYFVNTCEAMGKVIQKYAQLDKTVTFVVIDSIVLGHWKENVPSSTAKKIVYTGLVSEAEIIFACHNPAASNSEFSMQHFGYAETIVFENITLAQKCANTENPSLGVSGEHGIVIRGTTNLVIADSVVGGENSNRIRIYNSDTASNNSVTVNGGNLEGVFAGTTYGTKNVNQGNHTTTINGGVLNLNVAATRHQDIWFGEYNVVMNGGEIKGALYAGSLGGAFAGDAYVTINGGKVANIYTSSLAQRQGNNETSTDMGIKNGVAVTYVNGGEVAKFTVGADVPGGSALIISENATVPELAGNEADYVITVADGGNVEAVVTEAEYKYQPITYTRPDNNSNFTPVNNGNEVTYNADTLTGFKVTLPEGCNSVKLNGEIVELEDGVLALDVLSKDAVNEITFVATWTLKADLNGGNMAVDVSEMADFAASVFADGAKVESDLPMVGAIPNSDDYIKPYRSGYALAGWALTPDATAEECVEFPYTMTGDTTFYAIWEDDNDTPIVAEYMYDYIEKPYFTYEVADADVFDIPEEVAALGETEKLGAYLITLTDMATGEESGLVSKITIDTKDFDLEGKILYAVDSDGNAYNPVNLGNGKYEDNIAPGSAFLLFSLAPEAIYELEGTYYAKRNEYVIDVYYDGPAANAGSLAIIGYEAEFVDVAFNENVQLIENTVDEGSEGFAYSATWGVADGLASVGGDGRVHIMTINCTMTPEGRETFVEYGCPTGIFNALEDIPEVFENGYYLVAKHDVNNLAVEYIPVVPTRLVDTVGPDDMVTVKGTVEMSAREDGCAPVDGNYAVLYWKHKGAASYNKVVIEDADTDTAVVEYVLEDVPAGAEIEIYVEKNGYLTEKAVFTFEAKTEEETEEKPEREADAIVLTPGDIKGDFDDFCGDGKINIADFVRVLRGFDEGATDEYKVVVDVNEDGEVNVTDLGYVKANFGKVAE